LNSSLPITVTVRVVSTSGWVNFGDDSDSFEY